MRRHRDFCLALTAEWGNRFFEVERMNRVAADRDSFRAALEWSWREGDFEAALHLVAAVYPNWFFGNQAGAADWLERVLDRTEHVAHPARAEVLRGLAALLLGDPARQQALVQEAAALLQRLDDLDGLAALDFIAGEAALRAGDLAQARALLDSALSIFERLDHGLGIGNCHDQLGWVAVGEGDRAQARSHFERAVALAREHDSDWLAAQALSALAPLRVLSGDVDQGLRFAVDAITSAERAPVRMVLLLALTRAGETALLAADLGQASRFLGEGLRVISDLGTQRYLGDGLELVALMQLARGDHQEAATMFGASAAFHAATGGASEVRFIAAQARTGRHRLAEALGADRFGTYERAGQALPADQAIARARSVLQTLDTDRLRTAPAG